MLEEEVFKLADQEDWTAETIIALLTDFIENVVHEDDGCLRFLNTHTTDFLIGDQA